MRGFKCCEAFNEREAASNELERFDRRVCVVPMMTFSAKNKVQPVSLSASLPF